jgi:hypothetical protein
VGDVGETDEGLALQVMGIDLRLGRQPVVARQDGDERFARNLSQTRNEDLFGCPREGGEW